MTDDIHSCFENILNKLGFSNGIEHPVFYNSNYSIRFKIGHEEVYIREGSCIVSLNPLYVSNCMKRAEKLLTAVDPDIIRVDIYPDEEYYSITKNFLIHTLGSPVNCVEDNDLQHFYWNISDIKKCIPILREIIFSDISGKYMLNSCVYFVNTNTIVMYYLYDDRGADIAAENKDILIPIYKKFNDWILEYDRKKMEKIY